MNEKYINIAIKEAKKAYKKGEIPVGAVIVKNNKVISKGYNKIEKTNNPVNHAEIIAIKKACNKLKNWRLNDCILYVTMEPCLMCCGAILQSRISKVVYCLDNKNYGNINQISNKIEVEKNSKNEEVKKMLKDFFKQKR